jgi:hypothetical protein
VPLAGDYTRSGARQRQGGAVAMTPSADQVAAFQANGGFAPAAVSTVVLGFVFAALCCGGVCAPPMSAGPST